MKELKKLSQNGCQQCFQHRYSRWQKCIISQGNYLEGNVAEVIVLFGISKK
jgi:hypothetical protein